MNGYPFVKPILCLLMIILGMIGYFYIPINVKVEKISEIEATIDFDTVWWQNVMQKAPKIEEYYSENCGVVLPKIDYNKNNLVVSVGREIKSLKYKHISRFYTPYSGKPYIGEVVLEKEMDNKKIYFYITKKINLLRDDIGITPIKDRIEK